MNEQPSRNTSLLTVASLAGMAILPFLFSSRKKSSGEWTDISANLEQHKTPVYDGNPSLHIEWTSTLEKDGVNLSRYSLGSHTGTHVDAPLHFIKDGASIDKVDVEKLMGEALVIDVGPEVKAITAAVLKQHKWKRHTRILFKTRSSAHHWLSSPTFHRNFTYIAPDAARLLARAGVDLVGVDYLSIEQFGAKPEAHTALLAKKVAVVEGLDLSKVDAGEYDLIVLPLKIVGHEAAPARALLRKR